MNVEDSYTALVEGEGGIDEIFEGTGVSGVVGSDVERFGIVSEVDCNRLPFVVGPQRSRRVIEEPFGRDQVGVDLWYVVQCEIV